MEIHKQEQFPTIPAPEVFNDPSAAHNQTVAHKIAATFPRVRGEIGNRTDPNEIKTIPLRPGPLPPQFAKFPKFMWHAIEEPRIVNNEDELEEAITDGYLAEKPASDSATVDMLKAKIKTTEAALKQLKDNLAVVEKER